VSGLGEGGQRRGSRGRALCLVPFGEGMRGTHGASVASVSIVWGRLLPRPNGGISVRS
jgi:hypothetical protein